MRWTTKQPHLSAIVQAQRFSLFSHIMRMPDETNAKKILTASSLENWMRPPGRPGTTRMKTIQQDLKSNNLSLNEAIWRGSGSSTLETDVYVWHYALLVVHVRNEWMSQSINEVMNEWTYLLSFNQSHAGVVTFLSLAKLSLSTILSQFMRSAYGRSSRWHEECCGSFSSWE